MEIIDFHWVFDSMVAKFIGGAVNGAASKPPAGHPGREAEWAVITTDSTPAIKDVNDLVAFLVTNKIDAVFVESSVNQKNMRSIIEGCQEKNWTVKIGGKLYSDAMGTPGTYSGTYLGMMDHNATTIARALGGTAPDTGEDGKLPAAK